jgi:hypothetical protein
MDFNQKVMVISLLTEARKKEALKIRAAINDKKGLAVRKGR